MIGSWKLLGVGAACMAACSLPLILPALGLAGLVLGIKTWIVLGAILVALICGLALQRRRTASLSCEIDGSCGCKEGRNS